jgi:hypothetical protein
MSGEFRIQRYTDGIMDYDTGWFSNLIVDQGLLLCTTQFTWYNYTYIGSAGSAPTVSDTQMGALLASSTTEPTANVNTYGVAPNYEFSETVVRRFNAGVGTGTIREIGIGYNSTSVGGLFARHNVTPEITKAANQVVDVSYRFTVWPQIADVAGTSVISGITYDTITRGLNLDATNTDAFRQFGPQDSLNSIWNCWDGGLGALDANTPQGTEGLAGMDITWGAAAQGSRIFNNKWGLGNGNAPGGVRTIRGGWEFGIYYQTQYTAQGTGDPIFKDTFKELDLDWTFTWARK